MKNSILFDAGFNMLLGLGIILFYRFFESWLSPAQIMTKWFWALIGIVLLLYGSWQLKILIQRRIDKTAELISGIIAWIFFFILTYVLLFAGLDLYPTPYLVLWIADVYIVFGGIFFFWAYLQSN